MIKCVCALVFSVLWVLPEMLVAAPPQKQEVLVALELANDYFISKNPDPGKPTFVKKERPSNLWTRGVYFEGLIALTEVERQTNGAKYAPYKKYIEDWGAAHRWKPRNGVTTRDADDYCCCQTYLDMYWQERRDEMLQPTVECMDNVLESQELPWVAGGQTKSEGSCGDWTWIDAMKMQNVMQKKDGECMKHQEI